MTEAHAAYRVLDLHPLSNAGIACAHFDSSKWVAVLLSKDGAVKLDEPSAAEE